MKSLIRRLVVSGYLLGLPCKLRLVIVIESCILPSLEHTYTTGARA